MKKSLPCMVLGIVLGNALSAADQPQWGQRNTRNMVSAETGLPESFDPTAGSNVAWVADLGSRCYASAIVAEGKVFIGTNNDRPRDPRHEGDRGVLFCLNETDGSLCWQLVVPKLDGDRYRDWPKVGLSSPPTVEGNRVYVVTTRAELVCLDINGLADGNEGPYTDEAAYLSQDGLPTVTPGPLDADIVWVLDLWKDVGMYPHDSSHSSVLIRGDHLYLNTGNGVDNTHRKIRAPDGPALIVVDKATGRLLARDREGMGPRTFHCTWSSPSLGRVGSQDLLFLGGPDGILYAFKPIGETPPAGTVLDLENVWRFDCDPTGPKENIHQYIGNRQESPSNIYGMPVLLNGRVYVAAGGDLYWGKRQAWLKCINATGHGDITATNEVWSVPLNKHCCSTPAIHNGLVFIPDCGGVLHCLDADSGKTHWTHKLKGQIWGSALVADGKVCVGSLGREFCIFAASDQKRLLHTVQLDSPIHTTPTAANGTVYISTMKKLYALRKDVQ